MKIECTCKGLNSNCYKCFGNGYYDKDEINNKISYENTQLFSNIKDNKFKINNKQIQIKCPYCNISIGRKKLTKHINDFHTTDNTVIKFRKCLICGLILYENDTKSHLKLVHSKNINKKIVNDKIVSIIYEKSNYEISNIVNNKKNDLTKCSVCGISLKKTMLKKHLRTVHAEMYKNKKINKDKEIKLIIREKTNFKSNLPIAKLYVNEQIDNDKNNDMTEFSTSERDGSKDWHILRDNGRFGSYPIFEAMDDESSP